MVIRDPLKQWTCRPRNDRGSSWSHGLNHLGFDWFSYALNTANYGSIIANITVKVFLVILYGIPSSQKLKEVTGSQHPEWWGGVD